MKKNMAFTKLFQEILDSTIWLESNETRLVWITLLAMANKDGEVRASLPGLANRAKVSIEDAKTALECFKSPDEYSRTPDFEGRRIEEVEGGWLLLNYAKYRRKMNEEERREYNRVKQAERRARLKAEADRKASMTVIDKSAMSAQAEAEAEAEAEATEDLDVEPGGSDKVKKADLPEILDRFWTSYPRKGRVRSSKKKVLAAWKSTSPKPHVEIFLEALRLWNNCEEWQKDGGQFVPAADRYIRDRKFDDPPEEETGTITDASGRIKGDHGEDFQDLIK